MIRNMFDMDAVLVPSHDGNGVTHHTNVYTQEDLKSGLEFISYVELEPGVSIGDHKHGDDEEVYVIIEGSGEMIINGEISKIKTGDVILNKPHWTHSLANTSNSVIKILLFKVNF